MRQIRIFKKSSFVRCKLYPSGGFQIWVPQNFWPPPTCSHLELIYSTKFTQPPHYIHCSMAPFALQCGHQKWKPPNKCNWPLRQERPQQRMGRLDLARRRSNTEEEWRRSWADIICRQITTARYAQSASVVWRALYFITLPSAPKKAICQQGVWESVIEDWTSWRCHITRGQWPYRWAATEPRKVKSDLIFEISDLNHQLWIVYYFSRRRLGRRAKCSVPAELFLRGPGQTERGRNRTFHHAFYGPILEDILTSEYISMSILIYMNHLCGLWGHYSLKQPRRSSLSLDLKLETSIPEVAMYLWPLNASKS